jgi:hypothetical protein
MSRIFPCDQPGKTAGEMMESRNFTLNENLGYNKNLNLSIRFRGKGNHHA